MKSLGLVVLTLLAASPVPLAAQKNEATKGAAEAPGATLRVVVTISRYDGEKKTASLPYVLELTSGDSRGASVRMGVEVPVLVQGRGAKADAGEPAASQSPMAHQYRSVGANIDGRAESLADGRFKLWLTVEESSVASAPRGKVVLDSDTPIFRTFRSQANVILRDGQTSQYVAATDPVTGESARIEVALSVVK
jgi:hypothetical protein